MTNPQPYRVPQPLSGRPSGGLTALGILSIIYAILFHLCGSIVGLSMPLWGRAVKTLIENMVPDAPDLGVIFEGPFMVYAVIGGFVSLVLGLSFLVGGIGLLKLWPSGRTLCLAASVATIVWNIINFFVGILFVNPWVNEMMGQDSQGAPQIIGQAFGGIVGIMFQLALPIVLLIFLMRVSVKEQFESPRGHPIRT